MSVTVIASTLMSLIAAGGSVAVLLRLRDWRIGVLTTMLALLAADRLLLLLAPGTPSLVMWHDETELAGLAIGLLALAVVFFFERIIIDNKHAEQIIRVEQGYFEQLFESAPEAIVLLDGEDRVLRANSEFTRTFGYPTREVVGKRIDELIVPPQLRGEGRTLAQTVAEGQRISVETVRQRKDGQLVDVSILSHSATDETGRKAVYGIYRDITERKRSEAALRKSEERYALVVRAANDGLWDWDLTTDEVYFAPRWKSMLGYTEDEIGSDPSEWFDRVHAEDLDGLKRDIMAHLDGEGEHFENEHRVRHRDGTYRWMLTRGMAVREESGQAYRIAGSQTDITDRKLAEEALLRRALHDALTGLPNRTLFMDRLERSLARTKRNAQDISGVLFMDLDRFKVINDSLGHLIGDQLLIAVARRLQSSLRPGDTVARFGGDEFAVLLDSVRDIQEATSVAERIHTKLGRPFTLSGTETYTTASIGIALSGPQYENAEELLRDADTALHRAKANGRGRNEVFDARMRASVVAVMQLQNDLRRAIEHVELRTFYQPIISLESGAITDFEALVRWQHPDRGLIEPMQFIDLAEETGLIVPIDQWVLNDACREVHEWHQKHISDRDVSISVNLSAKQFQRSELVNEIAEAVQLSGLPPTSLHLEITESTLMEYYAQAGPGALGDLKRSGVQVHIDDFGTGYSSLSYLHRFQVDALKIDRSFVSHMTTEEDNREIVRTIVALARSLGMDVIAEGVETTEQLTLLKEMQCTHAQGYYFAEPMEPDAAADLLSRGSWNWGSRQSACLTK